MNIALTAVLPFLFAGSLQAGFQQAISTQRDEALRKMSQTMICGGPESMRTSGYLQDNATPVAWAKQDAASTRKAGTIVLSDVLALDTLTLGPILAGEAQAMIDDAIPECAEKAYFRRSVETRVWLELGGRRGTATPAAYRLWLDHGAEMALEKISQETRTEILPVLIEEQQAVVKKAGPAELPAARLRLEALENANSLFARFLQDESRWKRDNSERLR